MNAKDFKWLQTCVENAERFSTCGKRQYFAVILDRFGHVAGTGYNGGPKGMPHCVDGACPRLQQDSPSGSQYSNCIAIHSEANALLHSDYTARRDGGTLYVNGPPCWDCAKLIANSGISRVVHLTDPAYADYPRVEQFLTMGGICVEAIDPQDL